MAEMIQLQTIPGIGDARAWKKTKKKKYTIHWYVPNLGTEVYNKFEDAHYKTDVNKPIVLVGTQGEKWVIDLNRFLNTYTVSGDPAALVEKLLNGTLTRADSKRVFSADAKPDGPIYWAFRLPKKYMTQVATSWGDVLIANRPGIGHGIGDMILCADAGGTPNFNDMWVVNGLIFEATYNQSAFKKVRK